MEKQWIITEEQLLNLKGSYESNKEELATLENFINENGCTNEGLSDATESFEQGYNNALEYVFQILGVPLE